MCLISPGRAAQPCGQHLHPEMPLFWEERLRDPLQHSKILQTSARRHKASPRQGSSICPGPICCLGQSLRPQSSVTLEMALLAQATPNLLRRLPAPIATWDHRDSPSWPPERRKADGGSQALMLHVPAWLFSANQPLSQPHDCSLTTL